MSASLRMCRSIIFLLSFEAKDMGKTREQIAKNKRKTLILAVC